MAGLSSEKLLTRPTRRALRESEALLKKAGLLASDEYVRVAREYHFAHWTNESYRVYQDALNNAAEDYFSVKQARRLYLPSPDGNDIARQKLASHLLEVNGTQRAPVHLALESVVRKDFVASARRGLKNDAEPFLYGKSV